MTSLRPVPVPVWVPMVGEEIECYIITYVRNNNFKT